MKFAIQLFVIIFVCLFAGTRSSSSDDDYFSLKLLQLGDKFIYVSKGFKTNWYRAQHYCSSYGLKLIKITTPEQNFLLEEFLRSYKPKMDKVWIGGTDLGDEGVWRWVTTGQKITYTNWLETNPDNFQNAGACDGENCLEIRFEPGNATMFWNDAVCNRAKSFICEV